MSVFRKATKSKAKLRLALDGPSGSGKSFTALSVAAGLVGHAGRIAVIDTENGSAEKSAPPGVPFDVVQLSTFDPRNYIEMIQAAESEKYDVVVIDSLSHAWFGKGGELDLVDQATRRSQSKNSYVAWKDVTPLHNALIQAIIGSPCHIIATMRSKVDHVAEADERTGKNTYRKVGMAPIQREGMDYEFDIYGCLDLDHNLIMSKVRAIFIDLDGKVIARPDKKLGEHLATCLSDRTEEPAMPASTLDEATATSIERMAAEAGYSPQAFLSALSKRGVSNARQLSRADAEEILERLRARIEANAQTAIEAANPPATEQRPLPLPQPNQADLDEFGARLDDGHTEMTAAGKAVVASN